MTKTEELNILREAVGRLGVDSYLGPVLSREIPFIEQELRSDHTPVGILCRIQEAWESLKQTDAALSRGREALTAQRAEFQRVRASFDHLLCDAREAEKRARELAGNADALTRAIATAAAKVRSLEMGGFAA